MGHINVGPVYRVGQVEIEHSSKTSLFQETEGENLLRLDPLWYSVFRASRGFAPAPHQDSALDPLGAHSPPTPAELRNRGLTQMRIGGQRTAFEIYHCSNCKDL